MLRKKCTQAGCADNDVMIVYDNYEVNSDNTNGFKFNAVALKQGRYIWKAYYWNEPEEA